ncbi:putative integral membrane protein (TIGR02206 family) [Neobacillus niacini]|uniref:YwaF family protein n=1 Tax=Neobacillus niacini TaxID=86668 RepID=UPI002857A3C1|nr:TIGR02206 family membrane protein [Neobacillus niacini]MDR7077634.1 putative integral membrane protein (TIGR02206 family) [Neobacillus niacini]
MEIYFQADGGDSFILFSKTHWMTLFVIVGIIVLIFLFRRVLRKQPINNIVRIWLAAILIISEISLHSWLWRIGEWTIQYSLPFHLSSISILLSAALLLTKSYSLFEFTYFAGVGSALQAMITPDISAYTFPHFRYVHFFISHGGIVVANLYMVLVEKYKPTAKSVWKAFLYLNVYTIFVFLLNYFIEGNYMYISKKPVNPSILDYLGPWPLYILPLEVIAFITFLILYVPFWLFDRFGKR